jgi:hypothetical protein
VSNSDALHFAVFIVTSFAGFVLLLKLIFRRRRVQPSVVSLVWVSAVVVVGGMLFAKVAASSGLPAWVYYGIPAATTILLPPVVFRMRPGEVAAYICAAGLMPAVIHVSFSFILGWKEYLPFWAVPSLRELLS